MHEQPHLIRRYSIYLLPIISDFLRFLRKILTGANRSRSTCILRRVPGSNQFCVQDGQTSLTAYGIRFCRKSGSYGSNPKSVSIIRLWLS